jgi:hypothetical protein
MSARADQPKRKRRKPAVKTPAPQGFTPGEAREKITALFRATRTGPGFAAALAKAGFQLVKTTRRVLQAIDPKGGAHTLTLRIAAPPAEVEKRLAEIPLEKTPTKQTRERKARAVLQCTPEELIKIEGRAARAGLSVSGYLRALAFGKDTPQPRAAKCVKLTADMQALQELRYELRKIGGNINQIAHQLNRGEETAPDILAAALAEHIAAARAVNAALTGKTS